MTQPMGRNMMRKDGADHQRERHAIFHGFPKLSVMWKDEFVRQTHDILDRIAGQGDIDVVNDFAMPVSAEALKSEWV